MSFKKNLLNENRQSIIPKPRKNYAELMSCFLLLLCAFILYLTGQNLDLVLQCLIIHFTTLQVGTLLQGICNFTEEMQHVTSRYNGNYFRALGACLDLQRHALLFLLLCGAVYLWLLKESQLPPCLNLSLMCLCQLLTIIFGFRRPSAAEISQIHEQSNCNVAQGLAWSYYIGYLKLVLPHLENSVREFNSNQLKTIGSELLKCEKTWKLHILIPLNSDVYDDLHKADSRIQFINNLPEMTVDRAGIKKRSFKNSVYGVQGIDQKIEYCVLEYATPLQSLYAMSQDENAAFSRQDRIEQAKLFCRALEEILQRSKDCSGCYRLIVYDDSEESDKHFLSKTIIQDIRQQCEEVCVKQNSSVCETEQNCPQPPTFPSGGTELLISGSDQPLPLHSGGY
ncbi:stimulator of interferon genes protein isoform X2 [Anolis sagrei]|uniref:stimulator of interferon genes protein isoform X2 n=1 Tax=Anolis sagrei TaxID=38937 RepID=UPI00351FC938